MREGTGHDGPGRRGLTLLELLIALAITAVVSVAIATVTTAIARGMDSMNDARSALQRMVAAHARLRSYIHPARCFLDVDPARGFVIWLGDTRTNGRVNLSELRVFWFDPAHPEGDLTVEWAQFPSNWDEAAVTAADLELTEADDFFGAMLVLRAQGYTGAAVLADQITSVAVSHDGASLRDANRVQLTLGVNAGGPAPQDILMAFGMTDHAVPE